MNTEVTRFISFTAKDISEKLLHKMNDNRLFTYEDKVLNEHLFSPDSIKESAQTEGVVITTEENDELDAIQKEMNRKNASYFRVVEY